MPNISKQEEYNKDNTRVANFLSTLKGQKIIILEPEFNKYSVVKNKNTQYQFSSIIKKAIHIIKEKNPKILVSLSMMDTGSKNISDTSSSCGYDNCSLGDINEWKKPEIIFNNLLNELDFISFHQMIAQFNRDDEDPGEWDTPNIRKYSDEEIGIDFLGDRILNLTSFLNKKYNKPIFMPYITIATASWNDTNNNNKLEKEELNYYGWVDKAQNTYKRLFNLRKKLKQNGLFGFATMELFDNPRGL
jgi:hypothetical protein